MKVKKQQVKSPKKSKPKPKKEKLSVKDWEEIMGVNRDTYTRHNGAIRRK
jgi:hypothetical protein